MVIWMIIIVVYTLKYCKSNPIQYDKKWIIHLYIDMIYDWILIHRGSCNFIWNGICLYGIHQRVEYSKREREKKTHSVKRWIFSQTNQNDGWMDG